MALDPVFVPFREYALTPEELSTEPVAETAEALDQCEAAAEEPSPAVAELSQLLRERDQQIQELEERLRRVAADYENFRRRQEEEQKRRMTHLKEDLFRGLLPILDGLERAVKAAADGAALSALVEGVEMVARDYRKLLSSHGVEPICTEGAVFDPKLHEAMMLEERADLPDQSIVQELQRGYRMGERVLRPSLVKVASNTNPKDPPGSEMEA
ncbi:MAG: nucleotide exchange factor GrpE [Candidatus Eremiobacterota bacterium]